MGAGIAVWCTFATLWLPGWFCSKCESGGGGVQIMGSGACASAATVGCMVGAGACEAGGHVAGGVIVSVVVSLSTIFAGRVGGLTSLFLLATLRDLASIVIWACRMSIRRCKALVCPSLHGTNGTLAVGDWRAQMMLGMPTRM